ncbi:MAG: ABC transporter permease subunit [Deltaproteobacteria bacterium]|nr:ABC transporter permease subunit [Deltaproteobacteria bacterium]
MFEFPKQLYVPMEKWIDTLMDWIMAHTAGFFDLIGNALLKILIIIEKFLLWVPWPVVLILVAILAWRTMGKWWHGVIMAALIFCIGVFGYWDDSMRTLAVVIASVVVSLVIGFPSGIIMARSNRFQAILRPILDGMQTMPSFVYLIPAMMLFGLGKVPAVFATVIYAVPPIIRLTNVGIRGVPENVVEAARSFGASDRQILFDVQLPLAFPSIMVGVSQTTMMALAMVVIASMIGARGLGLEVLKAINRIEIGHGFTAGLSIVFLAIVIDRITTAFAMKQQKHLG